MGGTCGARCLTSAVTWTCLHCRRTKRCVLHGGFVSKLHGARKNTWPLGVDNTPAFSAPGHRSVARHSRCAQQSVPTRTQISTISNKIFWAPWHATRVTQWAVAWCVACTSPKNYTAARHLLPTRPHIHVHTVRTTLVTAGIADIEQRLEEQGVAVHSLVSDQEEARYFGRSAHCRLQRRHSLRHSTCM